MKLNELFELSLPKKLQIKNLHERLGDNNRRVLYSVYAIIYYLYNKMYELNLDSYNVTSHNMIHLIIQYLNTKSFLNLKEIYNKINRKEIEEFYTNTKDSSLYNQLNLLYKPMAQCNRFFIKEIKLDSFMLIDKKHYINSLYNEPLYHQPCMHFLYQYKYMYALPFYSLSPIIMMHNIMSSIFSKLKDSSASISSNRQTTKQDLNSIFDDVAFNEFNIINEMFYNIKTSGNNFQMQEDFIYPFNIDVLLFKSDINLNSLVRIKNKPNVLGQIYIMTNVEITENLLIPIIYEDLLYSEGVVFLEIPPYELDECKFNFYIKSHEIDIEHKELLTIENLLEAPHLIMSSKTPRLPLDYCINSHFTNLLIQSLMPVETNPLLFEKTNNNDIILFDIFTYWLEMGYFPSNLMCRQIINVSHQKQDVENQYVNGIFPCNDKVYYLKLLNIQNITNPINTCSYLPMGFYLSSAELNKNLLRITQTIFYNTNINSLCFSNYSLINSNIVKDIPKFFSQHKIFKTTCTVNFIQAIEQNSILKFLNKEKIVSLNYENKKNNNIDYCKDKYINIYRLKFCNNIHIYVFGLNNDSIIDFPLIDVINATLYYYKIQINDCNKSKKDFMFNILNIHELCR